MLNRSASLAMSTSVLKALPGKLDIKRHSPSILYLGRQEQAYCSSSEYVSNAGMEITDTSITRKLKQNGKPP